MERMEDGRDGFVGPGPLASCESILDYLVTSPATRNSVPLTGSRPVFARPGLFMLFFDRV
jgi:hypothetical protein